MGEVERNYNQYRPSGGGTYLRGRRRGDLSEHCRIRWGHDDRPAM